MQLLPGPKAPATIQVLNWIFRPMSYLTECAKTYGDLFTLKLQSNLPPMLFVHSPEAMQQVLSNDQKDLEAPKERHCSKRQAHPENRAAHNRPLHPHY